ncbi:hypothetical protein ACRU44_23530 [Mycobacterium colombiense]
MSGGKRTQTAGEVELKEIEAVYDQLGLLNPDARAKFAEWNEPECSGESFRTAFATATTPNLPSL